MSNVYVEGKRYSVDHLYQWDLDQVLEIYGLSLSSIPEIHFTNSTMDKAIVRQATMNNSGVIKVNIPNSLLQSASKITVYICTYESSSFNSLYKIIIPVEARPKPADYIISDSDGEIYSFRKLENLVNNVADNMSGAFASKVDELNRIVARSTGILETTVNEKIIESETRLDEKTAEVIKEISESEERLDTKISEFVGEYGGIHDVVTTHLDATNPHNISKTTLGLENVANERQYSAKNPPPGPFLWSGDLINEDTTITLPFASNWFLITSVRVYNPGDASVEYKYILFGEQSKQMNEYLTLNVTLNATKTALTVDAINDYYLGNSNLVCEIDICAIPGA